MTQKWLAGMKTTADRLNQFHARTISYTAITANTSTVTTVETVAITTPSITFQNGRAYRIIFKGLAQSDTAADSVIVRVRKTNTSGTAYVDQVRLYVVANNANSPFYFANICSNTTGADVTAALVGTYVRASGAGNVLIAASTNNVAYVLVEDIGSSDDYANATAIS